MTDQSQSHPALVKAAGGDTNCQGRQLESRGREQTVGMCGSRYSALSVVLSTLAGRIIGWGQFCMNDQTIKYVTSCGRAGQAKRSKVENDLEYIQYPESINTNLALGETMQWICFSPCDSSVMR